VEDTRQLGADAVVVDGTVVRLWRPRSPDDRPAASAVVAESARASAAG
jgi:ABC-type amino acid transport substrate-binding protein